MKKSLTYVIIFTCICLLTSLDVLMGILAMIIWLTDEVIEELKKFVKRHKKFFEGEK